MVFEDDLNLMLFDEVLALRPVKKIVFFQILLFSTFILQNLIQDKLTIIFGLINLNASITTFPLTD